MSIQLVYSERLSSKRTTFLFIVLTLLFLFLFLWRVIAGSVDFFASIFLLFFFVFLFYSLNYRTLVIRLTSESLKLSFGIFTWTILLDNIAKIQPDDNLPLLMKYGGAGIHFMFIHKRYRASFNFLEHPRVVVKLKKKASLVKDVSFSTCQPNEIIRLIQGANSADKTD